MFLFLLWKLIRYSSCRVAAALKLITIIYPWLSLHNERFSRVILHLNIDAQSSVFLSYQHSIAYLHYVKTVEFFVFEIGIIYF